MNTDEPVLRLPPTPAEWAAMKSENTKLLLQIDELKAALYAECRGLACESEGCYVGYRNCSGCEARAKKAYGPDWGKEVKRVEQSPNVGPLGAMCPKCAALLSSPSVRRCVNGHDF